VSVICSNNLLSAKERTRTSTGVTPLAPQASQHRRVCEVEEPTRTPIDAAERPLSGRVPQAQHGPEDLASEAHALLRLAALREDIPAERARAFAEAVLAASDVGRWGLAVLRGEPHAARALVELGVEYVRAKSEAASQLPRAHRSRRRSKR